MRYDNVGDIPLDELKHYGVKGMKWGVRRNRDGGGKAKKTKSPSGVQIVSANKARVNAASARRVSKGEGGILDIGLAALTTSGAQMMKAGGFKAAQGVKADKLDAYADRLESGRATTLDKLRAYGTTSIADTVIYGK